MAKKINTVAPVQVDALDTIPASENITGLAKTLKGYGINPGPALQQMLKVSNPVLKKALFIITGLILCIIGGFSIKGSFYTSHIMIGVSIAMSIGSIGILLLCYFWTKGKMKYVFVGIDILIATVEYLYFVPAAFGHEATAQRQFAYIGEEKLYADSITMAAYNYYSERAALYTSALDIAEKESAVKGPVYTTANNIANELKQTDTPSLYQQVTIPDDIMQTSITSIDDAHEVGKQAHESMMAQANKVIAYANQFKLKLAGVVGYAKELHDMPDLNPNTQRPNANTIYSKVTNLDKQEAFSYKYEPNYVITAETDKKNNNIAIILELTAILFLISLSAVMLSEEKNVDLAKAIDESQRLILAPMMAGWKIELGNAFDIDPKLKVMLVWLEKHPNTRKHMQQRGVTLQDFVAIYQRFSEDVLQLIEDGTAKFHLDEFANLPVGADDHYVNIITTMTAAQWHTLTLMVEQPEEAIDYADVLSSIWGTAPVVDDILPMDQNTKDMLSYLQRLGIDKRKAIRMSGANINKFAWLYETYGERRVNDACEADANFALGNMLDAYPEKISDDVLDNVKFSDMKLLDKYNISVVRYAKLTDSAKAGIIDIIQSLEERVKDYGVVQLHLNTMMKDLSIFTDELVEIWQILIAKIRLGEVLLKVTPDVLLALKKDTIDDFIGVINPLKAQGAIYVMQNWLKDYSTIIAKWKAGQIYDIALQEILKKAPLASTSGLSILFSAYEKLEKQLNQLIAGDEKARDEKKKLAEKEKLATTTPDAASTAVSAESVPFKIELDNEEPAETVAAASESTTPVEPVVEEEPLPVRKIEVNIDLVAVQTAKDENAIITLIGRTFKLVTAA